VTYTDPVTGQPVNLALKGGKSSPLRNNAQYVTDWSNFQPRFGFAYQVVPNTVVRGGYGISTGSHAPGSLVLSPTEVQVFQSVHKCDHC